MITMMLSSFLVSPSSSLAHSRKSSFLQGNPTHVTKIKNPSFLIGFSKYNGAANFAHPFIDSSLRASVKCFSQEEKQQLLQEDDVEVHEFGRLFSNLNQATLKREPGSLSSSIFLVAGTTVITGLLIAEVNVSTMRELGTGGVSLVSMAMRTLGNVGVQVACWSYIFIHYALLVAYVARSSEILTNFLGIPIWETATLFSMIFGGLCYFGSQGIIGAVNGALVISIIASFVALVVVASGDLHWDFLLKANLEAAPRSIPIIALSFVYQNVVPVLCTNLEGNLSKVRTAIVAGTAIPLALFLIWNAVILGIIPTPETGSNTFVDPLQLLRSTNEVVGPIVDVFSVLAIATSYIGFVLGLSDFLADLLKLPGGENRALPYVLTLVPPLILSLLDPEIFFKALDFAGTYGVLVLFGVLPAAMSWSDRYSVGSSETPPLVPGGKLTLSLVMAGSGLVILTEILENFGRA
ncbi:uncharacterized protein LOC131017399 isoform X2 [Salvia miltiorrhiza]|uniref:uncharacterized protein LOC131017399 isoform X2 n=1 Tax=Salvia miltiorrhiza TaxID=226208 RepID=UPI0025AD67F5|nr:uncharacterized protein LOC131017399 isoform X2 [Salvia miltiorrhiza]